MIPALLITFREVMEAILIVATFIGILTKLGRTNELKIVWLATGAASLFSILLLGIGSLIGFEVQHIFESNEAYFEGTLMLISAVFITWAVFFLHRYFGEYKTHLLQKVQTTISKKERHALFALVFTAVFREGFEIVLFLTTIFISTNPQQIFLGFLTGAGMALALCWGIFKATVKLPIFYAFRASSILLIFFSAGLIARGAHEFAEVGLLPELITFTFPFIPQATSLTGLFIKSIFGITQSMNLFQLALYGYYVVVMLLWTLKRQASITQT